MKKIVVYLSMVALLLGCFGCSAKAEPPYDIVFIPKSQISTFWQITMEGFYTATTEYNANGIVRSTENEEDMEGQIALVQQATAQGVDAIILSSISYEGLVESVEQAMDAGVEVVVIDSDVNVADIPVRISTDNYNAGLIMGEKMAELLNYDGQVGLVTFDTATANASQRITGFVDAISAYENMEIVCQWETDSTFDKAENSTKAILENYPEVDGLATFNEILTVGMSRAIESAEREDLVCMGFDNNTEVVDFLERGILDAIVLQNQFAMGYLGAQYAMELVGGQNHENVKIDTGVNVITRENMLDTDIQTLLYPFDLSD